MAEIESDAVSCENVNPFALPVKDIVGEEDTHSGHFDEKFVKQLLSALNMEDSDEEFTSEHGMGMMCFWDDDFDQDYMDLLQARQKHIVREKDTPGHDHDKCIKEQLTALNMEDSEKEITSEDEMDSRGLTCLCGQNHFKYAEYVSQIETQEIRKKYFPPQSKPKTKPLTSEEWDVLLTKKEMKESDMSLGDLWYSKFPPKDDDSEYALVWSDTDE